MASASAIHSTWLAMSTRSAHTRSGEAGITVVTVIDEA